MRMCKQFLVAILLSSIPLTVSATDYYVVKRDLNVRSGPGTRYPILFTLAKDDEVEHVLTSGNWHKIRHLGRTGYANSRYLLREPLTVNLERMTQSTPHYYLVMFYIVVSLLIVLFLYKRIQRWYLLRSVTQPNRGTRSERDLVVKLLKQGIPSQLIFHDLYLEKYKGHFSQIDLVAITDIGVIVFEVKEYSGWIFGSTDQLQWTQVLGYGKNKYRFYNPIKQNRTHISELTKQLSELHQLPLYSVIVFYGNCELKEIDFIPEDTFIIRPSEIRWLLKYLLGKNAHVTYSTINEIVRVLKVAVSNGGIVENQILHNENIRTMLDKRKVFA